MSYQAVLSFNLNKIFLKVSVTKTVKEHAGRRCPERFPE